MRGRAERFEGAPRAQAAAPALPARCPGTGARRTGNAKQRCQKEFKSKSMQKRKEEICSLVPGRLEMLQLPTRFIGTLCVSSASSASSAACPQVALTSC